MASAIRKIQLAENASSKTSGGYSIGLKYDLGLLSRFSKKSPDWHICRETFSSYIGAAKPFVFYKSSPAVLKRVINFIERAQDILQLHEKNRAKPRPTNHEDIVAFRMPQWWLRSTMRMSLFTILLRAGRTYRGRNTSRTLKTFWKTADKSKYLKNRGTNRAFRRFMEGHTIYKGDGNQWVNAFSGRSQQNIDEQLVK
jgi:hypothetical protein